MSPSERDTLPSTAGLDIFQGSLGIALDSTSKVTPILSDGPRQIYRDNAPPISWIEDNAPSISWIEDNAPSISWIEDNAPPISWIEDNAPPISWIEKASFL